MPTLINRDQSGFTKGCQASDATRRLKIDIIHHTEWNAFSASFLGSREGVRQDSLDLPQTGPSQIWFQWKNFTHYSRPIHHPLCKGILGRHAITNISHNQQSKTGVSTFPPYIQFAYGTPAANPKISGFTIERISHKISLFAGDIILMAANPGPSLAEIQRPSSGTVKYHIMRYTNLNNLSLTWVLMPEPEIY